VSQRVLHSGGRKRDAIASARLAQPIHALDDLGRCGAVVERAPAGEHTALEDAGGDDVDAALFAQWQQLLGCAAVEQRVAARDAASPRQTFAPIQRIGGETGWYYLNGFWRLRGLLDQVVGGVGLRRGRRDPVRLAVGDTLDFWRVEAFEQDRLLRLSAEMKTPGRIWLQFEVDGDEAGTTLRQTAIFDPHGLAGRAYWYVLYPIHYLIFDGMLRRIGQAAIANGRDSVPDQRPASRQREDGD
jgi:uncharacterized protein DUF2867